MPSIDAHIATDRAGRYLAQLCKHAGAMGGGHGARMHVGGMRRDVSVHTECSDTHGVLTFTPWGTCTLTAGPATLSLRIDATDEESLRQIQDVLTRDLNRFGRRDGLAIDWHAC